MLEDKHYPKIHQHPRFRGLREVLKTKMKTLKEKGMGRGPRSASALITEEGESFWKSSVFTLAPPLGLIKILCFYMSMNFGMRSGHYVGMLCCNMYLCCIVTMYVVL